MQKIKITDVKCNDCRYCHKLSKNVVYCLYDHYTPNLTIIKVGGCKYYKSKYIDLLGGN